MNGALAWRFWRDGLVLLVILGAAITATEVLLMGALGEFSTQELATWMRVEFVQRIMKTFLGADLTPDISATGFMALGFTHPLIYALIWTFILTAATRVPAAEVERGTSDLLYTLPLSRGAIHRSAGLSLALATTLLTGATLAGVSLGQLLVPMWEPLDLGKLTIVAGNLLALNLCVAAVATAVSACTSRRGVAIAIILAWLLASFSAGVPRSVCGVRARARTRRHPALLPPAAVGALRGLAGGRYARIAGCGGGVLERGPDPRPHPRFRGDLSLPVNLSRTLRRLPGRPRPSRPPDLESPIERTTWAPTR
jgi:hypothetical protein